MHGVMITIEYSHKLGRKNYFNLWCELGRLLLRQSHMVIVMIITGTEYISQLLNVTHTLQVLNIDDNNIGDDGMAVISEALQRNKSLTTLMVGRCGLSVKGTAVYRI